MAADFNYVTKGEVRAETEKKLKERSSQYQAQSPANSPRSYGVIVEDSYPV
jgi:hypothetical protein